MPVSEVFPVEELALLVSVGLLVSDVLPVDELVLLVSVASVFEESLLVPEVGEVVFPVSALDFEVPDCEVLEVLSTEEVSELEELFVVAVKSVEELFVVSDFLVPLEIIVDDEPLVDEILLVAVTFKEVGKMVEDIELEEVLVVEFLVELAIEDELKPPD